MNKNRKNRQKRSHIACLLSAIVLTLALFFTACGEETAYTSLENVNDSSQLDFVQDEFAEEDSQTSEASADDTSLEEDTENVLSGSGDAEYVFSMSDIPEYSGEAFVTVNDNTPTFTAEELSAEVYEHYSDLDSKGRCGVAMAMIGTELLPTEERGEIGSVKPSGWHTVKYSDRIDGNYLYNRCHLLAYELTGENANEKNLITGTRYMNVQGMLPFENFITAYVKETGNHVLYRVTPVFEDDDLVAQGVWMEAESVGAEGVCFSVFCYNLQPGVGIDYATGESWEDDTYSAYIGNTTGSVDKVAAGGTYYAGEYTVATGSSSDSSSSSEASDSENSSTSGGDDSSDSASSGGSSSSDAGGTAAGQFVSSSDCYNFIVNANTGKFHVPTCYSVSKMSDGNKRYYQGSAEELEALGYSPCGNCLD